MLKKLIYIFAISMVPVIELRAAIPIGAGMGLEMWQCFLAAVLGNLLPVPFLVLFGGKVLHWLAGFEKFGKPFRKILEIGEKKVGKMNKTLFWGLLTFVAIPLPGTGAWTGALIAAMLEMPLKKAFPSIMLGVLSAGAIVTFITYIVPLIVKMF
mgnify:CR=1 FL=1